MRTTRTEEAEFQPVQHTHAPHHITYKSTPMLPHPHQHPHHWLPLFLHLPFLHTSHHLAAHFHHVHDNPCVRPVHAPAILADTQTVSNVPAGVEGHILPIIRGIEEHAYQSGHALFNQAVDHLGMGGQEGLRAWSLRDFK